MLLIHSKVTSTYVYLVPLQLLIIKIKDKTQRAHSYVLEFQKHISLIVCCCGVKWCVCVCVRVRVCAAYFGLWSGSYEFQV